MIKKIKVLLTVFFSFFLIVELNANELDNAAACSGVVIGNAAVDYSLGDENSFKEGVNLAIAAYLSQVLSSGSASEDVAVADQILGSNTDKIINAANTETFDANTYEEVVHCYRMIALILLKNSSVIQNNQRKIDALTKQKTNLLKRILSAG